MNILIVRAFVKLREMLSTHKDLARKIEDLDRKQKEHGEQSWCRVFYRQAID